MTNAADAGVALDASNAAQALARRRWGSTRINGLIRELHDRAGELGPSQLAELEAVVAEADPTTTMEAEG